MDSHWAHVRAGYRCRHGNRNVLTPVPDRVRYIYIREDRAIAGIAVLLGLGNETPAVIIDHLRTHAIDSYCHTGGLITIADPRDTSDHAIAAIPGQRTTETPAEYLHQP